MGKDEAHATILDKRMEIQQLEFEINETADQFMGEGEAQWHHIDTIWGCDKSPFGWCAYHIIEDRAHDGCIYCHQPQERK